MKRYNRLAAELEASTIERLERAIDAAYRELEQEFLRQYPRLQSEGALLATQRRAVLMNDLGGLLQVIRPERAEEYQQILENLISEAGDLGGNMAGDLQRAIAPNSLVRAFSGINLEAAALQARDGARRLYRYNDDFRNKASAIVEQGLIQGWGAQRVARSLRGEMGLAKYNAERIARTETLSALNDSAQLRYQQNGITGVQWLCTIGEVCPFCVSRNMKVYRVGQVRIPAHPFCLTPGSLVSAPGVLASTKRKYSGEVVVIQTASGQELTVTPNHPILTPQGWIAAGLVAEGSDIFSCIDSERVTSAIAPHKYNRPAAIEEIVAAFNESSGVSSVGMKVAPEYFHGDGIGSEVCVVGTNRLLSDEVNAKASNHRLKLSFDGGLTRQGSLSGDRLPASLFPGRSNPGDCTMCGRDLIQPLFGSHSRPLERLSFGLRPDWDARLSEDISNKHPAQLSGQRLGDRILRLARQISPDDLLPELIADFSLSPRDPFDSEIPLLSNSSSQSSFFQDGSEPVGVKTESLASVLDRFAGLIKRDRVVKAYRKSLDGHVYNLQTQTGWYFANNILTHNCRCILLPWTPEWQELGLTDDEFTNQYVSDRLEDLTRQGGTPNTGLTPFERAANLNEPPTPIWQPRALPGRLPNQSVAPQRRTPPPPPATAPAPARSPTYPTALQGDHAVTLNGRFRADSLDTALNAISTPGAQERVGQFRRFVERHEIQAFIWDDSRDGDRQTDLGMRRVRRGDQRLTEEQFRSFLEPLEGANGFTGKGVNHVFLRTQSARRSDAFGVDADLLNRVGAIAIEGDYYSMSSIALEGISQETPYEQRRAAADTANFITYLHEMGHQAYNRAGNPPHPSGQIVSPTSYGLETADESFSENFALWMIDAERYRREDPNGASWVETTLRKASE